MHGIMFSTVRCVLIVDDGRTLSVREKIGRKSHCIVTKDRYPFQKGDKIVKVSGCSVVGLDADSLFQFMLVQNKPYSVEVLRAKKDGQPTFSNPLYEPAV